MTPLSGYVSIIKKENPGFKGTVPFQKGFLGGPCNPCDGRGSCLDHMADIRSKREQKRILKLHPMTCCIPVKCLLCDEKNPMWIHDIHMGTCYRCAVVGKGPRPTAKERHELYKQSKKLSFLLGTHDKLGQDSPIQMLCVDVIQLIFDKYDNK
jgi:hypothetical protein